MRKVFFFYFHKDKYYSSSPIVNNFKIIYKWQEKFLEKGIEMTSMLEYLPQYKDKNLKEKSLYSIPKEQVSNELMEAMGNIIMIYYIYYEQKKERRYILESAFPSLLGGGDGWCAVCGVLLSCIRGIFICFLFEKKKYTHVYILEGHQIDNGTIK